MRIEPFAMERMQSQWENRVKHNLSESGVHPLSVSELLDVTEKEALLKERLVYVQSNGSDALRSAIAAYYPGATEANVVVCNGTAEANFVCAWRLVEAGDEVVMVLPNYMQLWGVVRGLGGQVVPVHLSLGREGWGLDLAALEAALSPRTRLVVVCNPNNPTGAILSEAERKGLVAAVARHGSWLLVDEVYRGAERASGETPTLWGTYDKLLVTCGLSKAYGLPGLRVGWIVGPSGMAPELWARKDYTTISPGALSDVLSRIALRPKKREWILERTRGILRTNYPVLETWIHKRGGALSIAAPGAGAIGYVKFDYKINSTDLVVRLRDELGVLIVPGDHFGMDGFLRVGFGNEPEDLEAGLSRMEGALDSLPRS
jgi:aspartate/methionine/tyrosine aminotransferase